MLFLIIYSLSTFGAFYCFYITKPRYSSSFSLTLFRQHRSLTIINPMLAFIMSINFLSMAGIPPLNGFIIKFCVFVSLIESNNLNLVFFLIIISLVSAFYYIKPARAFLFPNLDGPKFLQEISVFSSYIVIFFFFINFFLIIEPRLIFDLIDNLIYNFFI